MLSKWFALAVFLGTQLFTCRTGEAAQVRIPRSKSETQSLCGTDDSGADEYGDGDFVAAGMGGAGMGGAVTGAVTLRSSGLASAVELVADFGYRFPYSKTVCSTIVRAAPNHMLSLSLVPTSSASTLRRERPKTDFKETCPLRVFLAKDMSPEREPLLTVDLCNPEELASAMHFVEALPHTVVIEWLPPQSADSMAMPISVVLTSIGKGERECRLSRTMVPCFKRSRKPILCVATELVCDGRRNCPVEGDDEDPSLCSAHGGEGAGGLQVQPEDTVTSGAKLLLENLELLIRTANSSTKQSTEKPSHMRPDGEAPTLAKYGTWGYLLLAMLACGGLLTMCGLWECCCRQSKANPPSPPHHSPTTVLIINQEQQQQAVHSSPLSAEELRRTSTPEPPAYDELDQPPAYGTLFPGFIKIEDIEEGRAQNVRNPAEAPATTSSAPPSPTPPRTISPTSSSLGGLPVSVSIPAPVSRS